MLNVGLELMGLGSRIAHYQLSQPNRDPNNGNISLKHNIREKNHNFLRPESYFALATS